MGSGYYKSYRRLRAAYSIAVTPLRVALGAVALVGAVVATACVVCIGVLAPPGD